MLPLSLSLLFVRKLSLFLIIFSVVQTRTSPTVEAKHWVETQWDKRAKIYDYSLAVMEFVKQNTPNERKYSAQAGRGFGLMYFGDSSRTYPVPRPTWQGQVGTCYSAMITVAWNRDVDSRGRDSWTVGYKELLKAMTDIIDSPCGNKKNGTVGGAMTIPGHEELRLEVGRDDIETCRHAYGKLPQK
jgi:hypothetical protein